MAHRPRDVSAGMFHIWTHCVWEARAYYRDDLDRLDFLRRLARVTAEREWRCMGFCLMRTHYHLLVEVSDGVLPAAMHALNHGYSCTFNRRHGLRGHVQSSRYGSRRIRGRQELLVAYAYAMNNPVDAGLCSRASSWRWSSLGGTLGLTERASFIDDGPILGCFRRELDPWVALRRSVEES
ncbi:MAG TPA: transposase [Gaiellaceae bacterium]|nr:transposase [Gaiellaceae bacterium]